MLAFTSIPLQSGDLRFGHKRTLWDRFVDHAEVHRARGIAKPRWGWGWGGVAEVLTPRRARQKLRSAADFLPSRKSSLELIVAELLELGAKYLRYLHQDEFGPTRAERMAALRALLEQANALYSKLDKLPRHLHFQLSRQLALNKSSCVDPIWGSYAGDERALEVLYEAAGDVRLELIRAQATHDAKLMEALAETAGKTLWLTSNLDTTTSSEMSIESDSHLEPIIADTIEADPLGVLCNRVMRLKRRFELSLKRLKRLRGPEPRVTLTWLVWRLCDLWQRETGQCVSSNAVREGKYTSEPQSPAGRFVLAAAEALQPSQAWLQEHEYQRTPARARVLIAGSGHIARAVHLGMRKYVAQHPPANRNRRGRPKGRGAIR